MQYIRSLFFNIAMYVWMGVIGLIYAPWAILSPAGARAACDIYARHTLWMLRVFVGLKTEVRGTPPVGAALLAAKHQSFLDIIVIWASIPRGFFVMKSVLRYAPVLGQYALRLGCIPVHRGKRTEAIKMMLTEIRSGKRKNGQLMIYPQGTRVAPGAVRPYKVGTFAMYEILGQPCYPVATNVGLFWPKRGMLRKQGVGVVEFLDPIPAGLDRPTFMTALEERIETASNRLMEEAGFPVTLHPEIIGDPVAKAVRDVARPKT